MKSAAAATKNDGFEPNIFLATVGDGRKILAVPKKQLIFAQGDYKPSHICLSRIRQQPRWSIPRKFSAYRS